MVELYLHNMALIEMNVWDPNARLGDLQLMAMASWVNHEELRVAEIRRLMIKEKNEPLMIIVEPSNPMALINTHNLLANNPQISPRYISDQAQDIVHFEDMERLLGDDCVHTCMRRWNTLPHSLQIREYHSPIRMKEALRRPIHVEAERQLDWPQIESPTVAKHARRQKRRRRLGSVGSDRQEGRIL